MGTHRYITTNFWKDSWISTLDPSERYLYIYLLTNPATNISGVYEITDKEISNDTGYTAEVIRVILDKFTQEKKCYRMGKYIVLVNWPKHQNWEKKETIKQGISKELELLSDDELIFLYNIEYKFQVKDILDKRGVPYPYSTPTVPAILFNSILSNSILSNSILNLQEKPEDDPDTKTFPEAKASETEKAIIPIPKALPKKKTKKRELTPEQLVLYHAAKACFESDEMTKQLLYQDEQSTSRYLGDIKTLVIRCTNMAPGFSAEFLKTILEHFALLVKGKLNASFTPSSLMRDWVWEKVIDSLPRKENPELIKIARGLFKE